MTDISYSNDAGTLTDAELAGFFVGWPRAPRSDERRRILHGASEVVLARDTKGTLVGFVTAITDGIFAACIPLVEVLPERQGEGIGRALVERMLARLRDCYMIDLVCDDDVVAFYEKLGPQRLNAMSWRNRDPERDAWPFTRSGEV